MSNPLISIIVAAYNVELYIEQCLQSLCNQTHANIEIIVVDDGSTDGTPHICDRYAQKDSRVVVIHKENEGRTIARNAGLHIASGEYIVCVDSDDWIESDMCETLCRYQEETGADVVMAGWYENTGCTAKKTHHGVAEGFYDKERMQQELYPTMISNGNFYEYGICAVWCAKLYKRDILLANQYQVNPDIVLGEDAACAYPALLQAGSVYVSHECLYHYRQRMDSTIKQKEYTDKACQQFLTLYHSVEERLKPYEEEYAGKMRLQCQWQQYMLNIMVPRADALYKGLEQLDFMFPFPSVKRGARVVIYGAGTWGQRLYHHYKDSDAFSVALWADRNYEQLREMELDVSAPEQIAETDFDYIVIAIINYNTRMKVREDLSAKYGEDKVEVLDEELIMSEETLAAFGLR